MLASSERVIFVFCWIYAFWENEEKKRKATMHVKTEDRLYWLKSRRKSTCWPADGFGEVCACADDCDSNFYYWQRNLLTKRAISNLCQIRDAPVIKCIRSGGCACTITDHIQRIQMYSFIVAAKAIEKPFSHIDQFGISTIDWLPITESIYSNIESSHFDWNSNQIAAEYGFIANGCESHLWLGVVFAISINRCVLVIVSLNSIWI